MFRILKHCILAAVLGFFSTPDMIMAQTDNVGIGTTTPNEAAILDIESPETPNIPKGVLIPRLNQIERDLMESQYGNELPAGLLIYEEDEGNFWYYKYDDPVPLNPPFGEWVMISTGGQSTNNDFPVGGIILWSGTIASIPVGWSLCDGSNGTPDLTDKFIVSVASAAENPGTAPVAGAFVDVEAGAVIAPDRRFFKLAYIMKL